ncbi:MAG: hypothetical protein HUN04_22285 [Desulfobacter sp.]|nr:MAG: hypothetical protein HUN04_22285 [Desulfobacter sp.]
MDSIMFFIILSILGALGLAIGVFFIYLIVFRKAGNSIINEGKLGYPFNLGSHFLNRLNLVWIGLVMVVFFGGLVFVMIQELYLQ